MERVQVAYINEQGVDLLLVPVDPAFQKHSDTDQLRVCAVLQACATTAGLSGTVVPVWDAGDGRMAFLAPREAHAFLIAIDLGFVVEHINGELRWGGLLEKC